MVSASQKVLWRVRPGKKQITCIDIIDGSIGSIEPIGYFRYIADFNLSGGCFGTEIIKNCTKWQNIGVHGLRLGPIEAEFQRASFLIQKKLKNNSMVQKNTNMLFFVKNL